MLSRTFISSYRDDGTNVLEKFRFSDQLAHSLWC